MHTVQQYSEGKTSHMACSTSGVLGAESHRGSQLKGDRRQAGIGSSRLRMDSARRYFGRIPKQRNSWCPSKNERAVSHRSGLLGFDEWSWRMERAADLEQSAFVCQSPARPPTGADECKTLPLQSPASAVQLHMLSCRDNDMMLKRRSW